MILETTCSENVGVSSSINIVLWLYVLQYKLIILFQISTIVKRNPVKMEGHVLTKWTAIYVHVSKGTQVLIVRQVWTD
jgi:hypothetical protein